MLFSLPHPSYYQHKSNAAVEGAAKAKTKALGRIKAAAEGAKAQEHKFVPFPDYARYVQKFPLQSRTLGLADSSRGKYGRQIVQ